MENHIKNLPDNEKLKIIGTTFNGLTSEERDKIKALHEKAFNDYLKVLKEYEDLIKNSKKQKPQ